MLSSISDLLDGGIRVEREYLYAWMTALLFSLAVGPMVIKYLRKIKLGQNIRAEGPKSHLEKKGTPTMGGVMIIAAVLLSTAIWGRLDVKLLWMIAMTGGFGLIGFLDDYIKTAMKRSLGLRAREKLFGQFILSALLAFYVFFTPELGSHVTVPFWKININLGYFYIPFAIFVAVAGTNAVNLTDGLDGLAAGTSAIAFATYFLLSIGVNESGLAVFSAAAVGACIGFLWFNAYPAKVFMGDTGSLALGGAISTLAILTKTEFLLIIIGGVFVLETLSVIIQVIYFKITGGRFFRMAPLHHHFELAGWHETKIVIRFWILGLILAAVALQIPFWP